MGEQPAGGPYAHASGAGPPAVLVHGTFVGGPESFGAQAPIEEPERFNDLLRTTWAVPGSAGKW
jgi:hypothetical protein